MTFSQKARNGARHLKQGDRGYLILYVMIAMFLVMAIGLSVLSLVGSQYSTARSSVYAQNAEYAANMCVQATLHAMNEDSSFIGYSDEVLYDELSSFDTKAVCNSTISDGSSGGKEIHATSEVYRYDGDHSPKTESVVAIAKAKNKIPQVPYSGILVGPGGMAMPALGSMYAKNINVIGRLRVGLYAVGDYYNRTYDYGLIGAEDRPVNLKVWNKGCGSASNWPQECAGYPITAWGGTTSPYGKIYGDVCAPGQPANSHIPGLLGDDCELPDVQMPSFDKKSFVENMTGGSITGTDLLNSCYDEEQVPIIPGYPQFGLKSIYVGKTYHLPANSIVVGDVDLSTFAHYGLRQM